MVIKLGQGRKPDRIWRRRKDSVSLCFDLLLLDTLVWFCFQPFNMFVFCIVCFIPSTCSNKSPRAFIHRLHQVAVVIRADLEMIPQFRSRPLHVGLEWREEWSKTAGLFFQTMLLCKSSVLLSLSFVILSFAKHLTGSMFPCFHVSMFLLLTTWNGSQRNRLRI